MYLIKRQRELLPTKAMLKSQILVCRSDNQKIEIVFEQKSDIRQVSLFITASVFYFIENYKVEIFMRTASKGRCHFVTLAGAAKCAPHFVVVNSRECAKHTLFLYILCVGKIICNLLPILCNIFHTYKHI